MVHLSSLLINSCLFPTFFSSTRDGGEIEQSEENSGKQRKWRRRGPTSSAAAATAAPEIRFGGKSIDVVFGAPFLINLTEEGRKKEDKKVGQQPKANIYRHVDEATTRLRDFSPVGSRNLAFCLF